LLSLSLAVSLLSFAGVPPLVGFFGKQIILSAALQNGYVFLVLVAILTSVISAVYYLNIIKEVFFNKSDYTIGPEYQNTYFSSSLTATISVLTLVILLFIVSPTE